MLKLLNCTGLMMFTLRIQISLMCFFRRSKIANSPRFFVNGNAGSPFVLKQNNTHKTRFVSFIWSAYIFGVASFINNTKINQSVVGFNSVNVINQTIRPSSMCVQPRQTMGFIDFLFKAYCGVAKLIGVTRNISNMDSFCCAGKPSKNSCVSVIMQQFTQLIRGKISRHIIKPLQCFNINTGIIT